MHNCSPSKEPVGQLVIYWLLSGDRELKFQGIE